METQDISGLSFTITKGGEETSNKDFPQFTLEEQEWYASVVKGGKVGSGQWGPYLDLSFELQGEGNTIELGGQQCQIVVRGKVNLPKEGEELGEELKDTTKLYEWGAAILGELTGKWEPKNLIGKPCFVMVTPSQDKTDKTKTWWNVIAVKGAKKKTGVAQATPVAATTKVAPKSDKPFQAKNPNNVTEPSQIGTSNIGTTKKGDVYEDVDF